MSAQLYAWYYPTVSTPTPKPRGYAAGHTRSRSAASVSVTTPPLTTSSSLASRKSTSSASTASSSASASSVNRHNISKFQTRESDKAASGTGPNGPESSVTFHHPALQVQGGAAGPAQAQAGEVHSQASGTPAPKKRQSLLHRSNSTAEKQLEKEKQKLQKKQRRRSNPFHRGHARSNSTDSIITPIPIPIPPHPNSDYHYNINTPGAALLSSSSPTRTGAGGGGLSSHDTSARLQSRLLLHRFDPAAAARGQSSSLAFSNLQSQQYSHYNHNAYHHYYSHFKIQYYPSHPLHQFPPHRCTCTTPAAASSTPLSPSSAATSNIPTSPKTQSAFAPTSAQQTNNSERSAPTPRSPTKLLDDNSAPTSSSPPSTAPALAAHLVGDIPARVPYCPSGPTPPHSPTTTIPPNFSNFTRKSIAPLTANPQPPPSPLQPASALATSDPPLSLPPPTLSSQADSSAARVGLGLGSDLDLLAAIDAVGPRRHTVTTDLLRTLTAAATDLVVPGRRCAFCIFYSQFPALVGHHLQAQSQQHQPGPRPATAARLGTDPVVHPDLLPVVATSTTASTAAPTPKVVPADTNNTTTINQNINTTTSANGATSPKHPTNNTPPPHPLHNPHSSPRLRPRSKFGKLATPSEFTIGFLPPRVALSALELKHVAMQADPETGRVAKMNSSAYSRSESLSSASGTASLSARTMASTDPSASGETLSMKSFITKNGRAYLNDPSIPYPLPVDLAELHRQSLRTLLLIQVFGAPVCSPAFASRPPARVLEVGCGSGFWSMMCHRYFRDRGHGNISFTGLDIAPLSPGSAAGSGADGAGTMPEFAKPDRDMNWRFIQHDIRYTPFPFADGEFDLVMVKDMSLAVTHSSQQRMVDEYIRLLRPGGHLEIWESDHTIRMLRPHVAGSTSSGVATQTAVAMPADQDEEHEAAASLGAYIMGANTPLSPPLNNFLVEYNLWLVRALELRDVSPVPCTLIGPMLLQESDDLCDVRSRRLAVPLSEVRWEKEGVGGVVTKDGKSYIDTRGKGKQKSDASGKNKTLSTGQAALRRTALQTVVQGIQALEPMLKDVSGKRQDEWDGWISKMMNDLMKENGTSWGECLEVGAWWAQKRA
ncbi:hypothetical protein jhhlp_002868 [Lomentospora prolificans]|uniref:Methyltransferase domain-containing protein n=1 Tax=Lomentospora prolificans TaxID=41688 RepID=A0A2N3NFD3_9PEZI|nr:hypothetical protein jhhlp_002868 [Lomentospora prolificans]